MIISHSHYEHASLEVDEPNLIPLLDFILVLLVMFVLLAGPIQHVIKLPLPEIKGNVTEQTKTELVTIYLQANDDYRVDGMHFNTLDSLKAYLQTKQQTQKLNSISLAANKDLPLQTILQVFALVKALGLKTADIQVNK
ncbi:ExbD/TolR family protein [Fastidiosibacter lacustris]|uniref:ExbD/TolR family protein n=1 Tax=Fastidiosibacter lacustris TaxID=2056695 RepID=UPI000E3569EC|nr:biopolymer transporter ExbD [Fastidiosibacter lacustris]